MNKQGEIVTMESLNLFINFIYLLSTYCVPSPVLVSAEDTAGTETVPGQSLLGFTVQWGTQTCPQSGAIQIRQN